MKPAQAFSLLEVMLATAIFSLAVVGLARGLGDMMAVLGGTTRVQQSQRELDSAAMRILATSNRLPRGKAGCRWPGRKKGSPWFANASAGWRACAFRRQSAKWRCPSRVG